MLINALPIKHVLTYLSLTCMFNMNTSIALVQITRPPCSLSGSNTKPRQENKLEENQREKSAQTPLAERWIINPLLFHRRNQPMNISAGLSFQQTNEPIQDLSNVSGLKPVWASGWAQQLKLLISQIETNATCTKCSESVHIYFKTWYNSEWLWGVLND